VSPVRSLNRASDRSLSLPFVAYSSVTHRSGRPVVTSIHDVNVSSMLATILTRPTAFA
jgi:hypothetical protein